MPFTDEDKKEIRTLFGEVIASEEFGTAVGKTVRKIVPGIVTDTLKKDLEPVLSKVTGFETKFTEIDERETQRAADDAANDKSKKKGANDPDPEVEKRFKKLSDELAAEKKKRETAEKEAQDKETARISGLKRSTFIQTAGELGIEAADIVYSYHEKQLGVGEDGLSVVVNVKDNGVDEAKPLGEFLEGWKKTDQGKRFVRAPGAGGSGAQPGTRKVGDKPTRESLVDQALGL